MDVWSALAVAVALLVVLVLGPPMLFRGWSWGEKLDALRRRLAR